VTPSRADLSLEPYCRCGGGSIRGAQQRQPLQDLVGSHGIEIHVELERFGRPTSGSGCRLKRILSAD
jgi:hypothetical protein